jgi:hypothetical protein
VYWDADREDFVRVVADSGRLVLERGSMRTPLAPQGPGRFGAGDLVVRFEPAAARRPARLLVDDRAYARIPDASAAPAALAAYVGSYRSDELLTTWRATAHGDTLVIRGARETELRLRPVFRDTFVAQNGTTVRFHREGSRVVAMVVTPGRSRRLRLDRLEP